MFACLECGKKFRTHLAAERAVNDGCPKCGGVDIDLDVDSPKCKKPLVRMFDEPDYGGAFDGVGTVYSDADPGL